MEKRAGLKAVGLFDWPRWIVSAEKAGAAPSVDLVFKFLAKAGLARLVVRSRSETT